MTSATVRELPANVMTKTYEAPFVRSDAGALAGAVVCTPSTAIDRIVPLKSEGSPIAERAIEAHGVLVRTLRDRGVDVTVLEPASESSLESLVGDAAIVLPKGAVIARPSAIDGRTDAAHVERALAACGIPILGRIESPGLLDASDVVLAGDRIYVGVARPGAILRSRSNELGRRQLAAIAEANDLRVVELATEPDVARLRSVFNVIGTATVLAAAERVDLVPVRDLRVIEVPRGEEWAAGVLAFGECRVIANLRFRESIRLLRSNKVEVEAIDLWEFGKAGIGPFQLVLATKRG